MTLGVAAAVLLAALLHASWNALVKGGGDKLVSMAALVLGHVPIALLLIPFAPLPSIDTLPWLLAGIGLHLGYQLFLAASYKAGDLTQVYPIARGSAPLIVAAVSIAALGVALSGLELAAITLIALGILSLALVRKSGGGHDPKAVGLALTTGGFIAAYSLVDGIGAREAGTALGYWNFAALGNAILFAAVMVWWRPSVLRRTLTDPGALRVGLLGGTASYAAYGIVIWAFTQAPIALVTALRETSIVFALIIGVLFLRERLNLAKVAATMLTIAGAALLRFARP